MDDDVNAAEALADGVGDGGAAPAGAEVHRHEQISRVGVIAPGPGGREHPRPGLAQPRHHRLTDPLGATCDERAAAIEFERVAHKQISRDVILSRSSPEDTCQGDRVRHDGPWDVGGTNP
jgi:hypothetical protein